MGQADGTIVIDTTITDEGFVAGTKEMETAARRMAESVSGIGDKAKTALQKQANAVRITTPATMETLAAFLVFPIFL